MSRVELVVELVVPDATSITAFNTLKRMGFRELSYLKRSDYYNFNVSEPIEKFSKKIGRVDILVNSNKHRFFTKEENKPFAVEESDGYSVHVLVKSIENDSVGLLSTLRNRLGFKQVKSMEKGTLWTLGIMIHSKEEASKIAEYITKSLLYNQHYQKYKIMG